jgi:hypothetical protein
MDLDDLDRLDDLEALMRRRGLTDAELAELRDLRAAARRR